MRGFYLILGTFVRRSYWPAEFDLEHQMPVRERIGYTLASNEIPAMAKWMVRKIDASYWTAYDIAAYRVTGPTTAELVWHKPEGHERGRWVRRGE